MEIIDLITTKSKAVEYFCQKQKCVEPGLDWGYIGFFYMVFSIGKRIWFVFWF